MPRTRGLYSIVQYIPDGARAEGANVGVALFVPDTGRVFVRVSPTLARVKKFFSPDQQELRRIELAVESLRHRLELGQGEFHSEADFERFIAARADAVRLTAPRLVVLAESEPKLDKLYAELVGDKEQVWAAERSLSPLRFAEVVSVVVGEDSPQARNGSRPTRVYPRSGFRRYESARVSESKESAVAIAD